MHTDRELQDQIMTALGWEPDIDLAHIGVSVNKGVVTLEGVVATSLEKAAAEDAARHVDGVRAVANDLEINPCLSPRRRDPALAEAVADALRRRADLPLDGIQATIDAGRVVLTGAVTWESQRAAAELAVQQLPGVRRITNEIIVKPQASVEDVKARIERAFHANAEIDAQNVRVEIRGGAVVLTGTIRSESEREEAERAVWSAPGVTNLDDRLLVAP
jgi:osmotically-inducible protein OsmY